VIKILVFWYRCFLTIKLPLKISDTLGVPMSLRNRNRITQYVIKGVGNTGMQANVPGEKDVLHTVERSV